MKPIKLSIIIIAICFLTTALKAQSFLTEGKWRGVFHQPNGTDVPFNFEVTGKTAILVHIYLLNGSERFPTSGVSQKGDTVYIAFDQFETELALKVNGNKANGFFRRKEAQGRNIPVDATFGDTFRFADNGEKPAANISGKYDVYFNGHTLPNEKKVGLFKQEGSKLTATFLSISGDYRYLEGVVQGNKFYLSAFIGGGVSYFSGSFDDPKVLNGKVGNLTFVATKNEEAALPDPYKLTYLKEGYKTFDFTLTDADGKKISLQDEKFKNKVTIITIGGTWCPNCMDEATFMAPWYKVNKARGVEVIGIQFERKADPAYVKAAMEKFKARFGIEYTELFGGIADKNGVAAAFPALNTFLSYPTMLFIDKKGNVDKIYTGFTGPATGDYYTQFIKEFNEEVDKLLL